MSKKIFTNENSEKAMNEVIKQFQEGDGLGYIEKGRKFVVPDEFPSANYSLRNKILLYMQADSMVAGTYNFWKKNGRYVDGSGKQAYIYAPMLKTYTKEVEKPDGSTEEQKKQYLYGFRPIPVYPIEHTKVNENFEGEPIEKPDLKPAELPPLTGIAEKLGLKVDWKPVPMDRWADYSKMGKRINMGTDSVDTLFHELAHALHAETDSKYDERSKKYKEVVAEFCSAVMMRMYLGEDKSGTAWEYIQHFADDPLEAVGEALYHIESVLNKLEELTAEEA